MVYGWRPTKAFAFSFVQSLENLPHVLLTDVEALNINRLRAGNIIFELVLITPDKLRMEDITHVYAFEASPSGDGSRAPQEGARGEPFCA
jgi:hypothetical protein